MITIIKAHPWDGSFNQVIFEEVKQNLQNRGQEFQVINLYDDQFDPVLSKAELKEFSKGLALDPKVVQYQKMLKSTDQLILIYPIWWGDTPAILKGFLDKVMLKNTMYEEGKVGLKGLLTTIHKTTVITTSSSPKWYLRFLGGNSVQGLLINTNFKSLGIKNAKWLHCALTKSTSMGKRKQFLEKVRTYNFVK